jgi:GT2 family glycosyltransferase
MNPVKTAVVVLNWNSPEDTVACLESICLSDTSDYGIIVVDNGSSDHSAATLTRWMEKASNGSKLKWGSTIEGQPDPFMWSSSRCSFLALVLRLSNDGYAAGNTAGIKLARRLGANYAWILNNDTLVAPSALRILQERATSSKDIAVAGALIVDVERPDRIQCFGGGRFNLASTRATFVGAGIHSDEAEQFAESSPKVDFISGACMFCSLDALATVDDLCPEYFLFFEDFECCYRLRHLGYRLAVDSAARVYHRGGGSSGSSSDLFLRSPTAAFHASRSAIIFYRRNHAKLVFWAVAVRYVFGLLLLLRRRSLGVAVLRGIQSGLKDHHLVASRGSQE